MAGVRFSSHTNSTLFTTCCKVAICDDQSKCPVCGEAVPYSPRERWNMAMYAFYGVEEVQKMRAGYQPKPRKRREV